MISIKKFKDLNEEEIDNIIEEQYSYWVKIEKDMDRKNVEEKYKNLYSSSYNMPYGIALYDDANMVGFCILKKENLKYYKQYTPWISEVMIFKDYRRKGYGSILIREALNELASHGFDKAYLYTDHAPVFYEKLGFEFKEIAKKSEGVYGNLYTKSTRID